MTSLVTITMNPSVDKRVRVKHINPNQKLRCLEPEFEPGGGGINISRVLKRLGCDSLAIFPSGGYTGKLLQELLYKENVKQEPVEINNWTRENFMVVDDTEQQFRFINDGPEMTLQEGILCLNKLENLSVKPDYIIASGSLPQGLPSNFFAMIAQTAESMDIRFILDTSGDSLQEALKEKIFLLKPNLLELSKIVGVEYLKDEMILEAAKQVISNGHCEILVVSLGASGALFVSKNYSERVYAPSVKLKSTVGAGDSMVAGMVSALLHGKSFSEVIRYGVACGTAATVNPGTELCLKKDVESLYKWMNNHYVQL